MKAQILHSHILLIGANGSGKTTHGRVLAGFTDRQYVDMSRIIKLAGRYVPQFDTESNGYVAEGLLVPDSLLMPQVRCYFESLRKGERVVMSGLFRDPGQALWTRDIISATLGSTQLAVVDLDLSEDDAIKRCKDRAEADRKRGVAPRSDDLDETKIRGRIALHNKNKAPVIDALIQEMGATIHPVKCCPERQDTMLAIIRALGLTAADLAFVPAGLC